MEELDAQLSQILTNERKDRRFLIPLLQDVQLKLGYISYGAMLQIASFLEIHPIDVWGVVTFYNQFRLKPHLLLVHLMLVQYFLVL